MQHLIRKPSDRISGIEYCAFARGRVFFHSFRLTTPIQIIYTWPRRYSLSILSLHKILCIKMNSIVLNTVGKVVFDIK